MGGSQEVVVQARDSNISAETIRKGSIGSHRAHGGSWQLGKCIGHHIGDTWDVDDVTSALSNEGKLPLLPRGPRLRDTVQGCQQWLVVSLQLELAALQCKPEVADGLEGSQEHSVVDSFLKKNPRGGQPFTSFCWRTPLMWVSEASVARESSARWRGCASSVAVALMASKDCCSESDQSSSFGLPFRHSVSGLSVRAATVKIYHT